MEIGSAVLLVAVVCFSAYTLFSGFLDLKAARRLATIRRTVEARSKFGEARFDLFRLVREGKLDSKSQTFRDLYGLNTYILRRPDQYDEIAKHLVRVFAHQPNQPPSRIAKEAQSWPPEMRGVLELTFEGIGSLILSHNRLVRILASIERNTRLLSMALWLVHKFKGQTRDQFVASAKEAEAGARELSSFGGPLLNVPFPNGC